MIAFYEGFTKGGRWIQYPTSIVGQKKHVIKTPSKTTDLSKVVSRLIKKYVKTNSSNLKLGKTLPRRRALASYSKRFF